MKNTIGHNRWEISRTESPGNHMDFFNIKKPNYLGGFVIGEVSSYCQKKMAILWSGWTE
jgi:hypothetical protein